MILRRLYTLPTLAFLLSFLVTLGLAQDDSTPFDCFVNIGDRKYDLHSIDGEHSASRERDSPPTKFRDTVRFNLCADLKNQDGVPSEDQVSRTLDFL